MTAPAQQKHPLVTFKDQLDQRVDQFRSALPAHMPVERFSRVVLTAVQNNLDLLQADRQSLWNSCMRAAQDGLLPDGREGAIVIYNTKEKDGGWLKKAQWMPMVFGILKKARNSGQLAMITARVVYAGDTYRYWLDEGGEHILYEPGDNPDRNIVRCVFAAAKTKDGELLVEPLTPDDIEKIRAVSRAKDKGPWVDWWEEMAKKSAIRRLAKRLPMSSDLDDLVRRDDDLYDFNEAKRPAQLIDLDAVGTDEHPTGPKPAPAPRPAETQSPAAGESAGADTRVADGASGGQGQTLPADNSSEGDDPLLDGVAQALIDCRTEADCDAVRKLFTKEISEAAPDVRAKVEVLITDRKEALSADRDADDDFPGDKPQPE